MVVNTNMLKEFIGKFTSTGCTKDRTGVCNCGTPKPEGEMANYKSAPTSDKIAGVAKK